MRAISHHEPAVNTADNEAAARFDMIDKSCAHRGNPGPRLHSIGVTRTFGAGARDGATQMPLLKKIPASPGRPAADHFLVPATGFRFPRQLPFETWLDIGRQLSAVLNSSAWCLGDWVVYGEVAYTGRYREAIERTSLDYQTLRNYAWVSRRFSLARRREMLSFGHHAEVAALPDPEQDYWLRKAEELGWSRNQIRHEVRTSIRERKDGLPGEPGSAAEQGSTAGHGTKDADAECADAVRTHAERSELTIQVAVTAEQFERYQQAASQYDQAIQVWATLALDQAVRHGLSQLGPNPDSPFAPVAQKVEAVP